MKSIKILMFVCVMICLQTMVNTQEDNKKANPLLRRSGAGGRTFGKATTTTAAPEYEDFEDEQNEDENGEGEVEGEEGIESSSTTSTEPPKRVGPIIRPFRSNDDLLLALKRRQMNSKTNKPVTQKARPQVEEKESAEVEKEVPAPASASAARPSLSNLSNRRSFGRGKSPAAASASQDDQQVQSIEESSNPVTPRRSPGRSRFALGQN